MAAENARVDTTFIGYLLIGFVLLIFGVLGLQWGELFGDVYKDMPIDTNVFTQICGVVGLILILLTVFAYRTGKQISAVVFAFTGFFLIATFIDNWTESEIYNSDWFMFLAFAIFFLIIAIYALIAKAPKFLAVLLVLVALMALFIGLGFFYAWFGPGDNYDLSKTMGILLGIFGFLGFVVATYLGLAYANPKKIPLI